MNSFKIFVVLSNKSISEWSVGTPVTAWDLLLNLVLSENIIYYSVSLRTSSSVFIASYHTSAVALVPAYGSYARSASDNQNFAVLPKRLNDSLFSTAIKIKTI